MLAIFGTQITPAQNVPRAELVNSMLNVRLDSVSATFRSH